MLKNLVFLAVLGVGALFFVLGDDFLPWVDAQRGRLHDLLDGYEVQRHKVDGLIAKSEQEIARLMKVEANAKAEIRIAESRIEDLSKRHTQAQDKARRYAAWLQREPNCPSQKPDCTAEDKATYRSELLQAATVLKSTLESQSVQRESLEKSVSVYEEVHKRARRAWQEGRNAVDVLKAKRDLIIAKMEALENTQKLVELNGGQFTATTTAVFEEASRTLETLERGLDKETYGAEALQAIAEENTVAPVEDSAYRTTLIEELNSLSR